MRPTIHRACKLAAVAWYAAPIGERRPGVGVRLLPPAYPRPVPPAGWQLILNVWQN